MLTPRGNGFEIEGPLSFHVLSGVCIEGLELDELVSQHLFGGEHEGAAELVRITVEVIEK